MVAKASVERLLAPVLDWLADGGDPWEMDIAYWRVRRQLMDEGEVFAGIGWEVLADLDATMDVFSPKADRSQDQIGVAQLRNEIRLAIERLHAIGLTDRPGH
jgi:hypothetical protein